MPQTSPMYHSFLFMMVWMLIFISFFLNNQLLWSKTKIYYKKSNKKKW